MALGLVGHQGTPGLGRENKAMVGTEEDIQHVYIHMHTHVSTHELRHEHVHTHTTHTRT